MPSSLYASHDSCIALLYTYTTVSWYIPKNVEDTVHREVEIMQHLSGHPAVVTLKAICGGCKSKPERDKAVGSQGLHIPPLLDFLSKI